MTDGAAGMPQVGRSPGSLRRRLVRAVAPPGRLRRRLPRPLTEPLTEPLRLASQVDHEQRSYGASQSALSGLSKLPRYRLCRSAAQPAPFASQAVLSRGAPQAVCRGGARLPHDPGADIINFRSRGKVRRRLELRTAPFFARTPPAGACADSPPSHRAPQVQLRPRQRRPYPTNHTPHHTPAEATPPCSHREDMSIKASRSFIALVSPPSRVTCPHKSEHCGVGCVSFCLKKELKKCERSLGPGRAT